MAKRILVVDDDDEILTIISDLLEGDTYEVVGAQNGLQAIEDFRHARIDLILMDICMPLFSGLWYCRAFKERPQTREIPIVVVSSLSNPEDIEKAYRLGASAYIRKPFKAQELIETVEKVLRKKPAGEN